VVHWLERELIEQGVEKVVPDVELLAPIWHEVQRKIAYHDFKAVNGSAFRDMERQLAEARVQLGRDFEVQYAEPTTPEDLREQVREYHRMNPDSPWDVATEEIAEVKVYRFAQVPKQ
jgi:hypothetical protein